MKMPNAIQGVFRRYQREGGIVVSMGINPQDYCQDNCNELYEIGSEEHDDCWESCRD